MLVETPYDGVDDVGRQKYTNSRPEGDFLQNSLYKTHDDEAGCCIRNQIVLKDKRHEQEEVPRSHKRVSPSFL